VRNDVVCYFDRKLGLKPGQVTDAFGTACTPAVTPKRDRMMEEFRWLADTTTQAAFYPVFVNPDLTVDRDSSAELAAEAVKAAGGTDALTSGLREQVPELKAILQGVDVQETPSGPVAFLPTTSAFTSTDDPKNITMSA